MYDELILQPGKVSEVMQAFHTFLGTNDMMAYLAMMAPRLVELRRVLKPTGSLYLHCDPTASAYLKLLLDAVFGHGNFLNEIVWKRTHAHGSALRYGPVHDTILFYGRGDDFIWTCARLDHDPEYVETHFTFVDEKTGRRFSPITLTGSGVRHGDSGKPWRGIDPTKVSRHWALPGKLIERLHIRANSVQDKLDALDAEGMIYWPDKAGGTPRLKWFADELEGAAIPDVWSDIAPIPAQSAERLGYPTQKPLALLERIVSASSNPGDLILNPFCGCGTTIDAAEKLGRKWIGIDITQLATSLIKNRLRYTYGDKIEIVTVGEPTTPNEAFILAEQDKYQFQWWALGLVGARPVEQKKGADHGIDGKILFRDDPRASKAEQIIIQVKGGKTGVKNVRDLRGVLEREKAAMGVLISLQPPTCDMVAEAASAGSYEHKSIQQKYPRLQLRTVKELMEGNAIERPSNVAALDETFKKAPESKKKQGHQKEFGL